MPLQGPLPLLIVQKLYEVFLHLRMATSFEKYLDLVVLQLIELLVSFDVFPRLLHIADFAVNEFVVDLFYIKLNFCAQMMQTVKR